MFDVVSLGELLIDFTPSGISPAGNAVFERNPGGAPANVLTAVSKLGKTSAFMGMVGYDQFGMFLKYTLEENKIDTSGLKFSKQVNTTLAFVHLDEKGDRTFSFYRNPGADMMFSKEDINFNLIRNSKIFHFGSISLTHEPVKSSTFEALSYAKGRGVIVSFDPNLRPPLWDSLKEAKRQIKNGLKFTDILKVSEEELEFITGTKDLEKGSNTLCEMGISIVMVTLGPKGSYYRYQGGSGRLNTYDTRVVDTTGAGDGFLGGVLYKLAGMSISEINYLPKEVFEEIIDFGNAVGSLVATKKGAISAMPSLNEVSECRNRVPALKL